jgi:hypothetical protein
MRVPIKCETKRNEINENETKRNETKSTKITHVNPGFLVNIVKEKLIPR